MPTRLVIAYSLIALMVAATAAVIWWKAYHSHHRTYERRRRKVLANPTAGVRKPTPQPVQRKKLG